MHHIASPIGCSSPPLGALVVGDPQRPCNGWYARAEDARATWVRDIDDLPRDAYWISTAAPDAHFALHDRANRRIRTAAWLGFGGPVPGEDWIETLGIDDMACGADLPLRLARDLDRVRRAAEPLLTIFGDPVTNWGRSLAAKIAWLGRRQAGPIPRADDPVGVLESGVSWVPWTDCGGGLRATRCRLEISPHAWLQRILDIPVPAGACRQVDAIEADRLRARERSGDLPATALYRISVEGWRDPDDPVVRLFVWSTWRGHGAAVRTHAMGPELALLEEMADVRIKGAWIPEQSTSLRDVWPRSWVDIADDPLGLYAVGGARHVARVLARSPIEPLYTRRRDRRVTWAGAALRSHERAVGYEYARKAREAGWYPLGYGPMAIDVALDLDRADELVDWAWGLGLDPPATLLRFAASANRAGCLRQQATSGVADEPTTVRRIARTTGWEAIDAIDSAVADQDRGPVLSQAERLINTVGLTRATDGGVRFADVSPISISPSCGETGN